MKTYTFPYGGTTGKCDGWDSEIDFELTDEESARLEASARSKPRYYLDDDPAISDIFKKVERFIFEETKQTMLADGRMDELLEDWAYFHEGEPEEDAPSDDEMVEYDMGSWHVCYPVDLQYLDEEEDEE